MSTRGGFIRLTILVTVAVLAIFVLLSALQRTDHLKPTPLGQYGVSVEAGLAAKVTPPLHSQRLAIHQISLASAFIENLQLLLLLLFFSGFRGAVLLSFICHAHGHGVGVAEASAPIRIPVRIRFTISKRHPILWDPLSLLTGNDFKATFVPLPCA